MNILKLVPGSGVPFPAIEGPVGTDRRFLPATEIGGPLRVVIASALEQLLRETRLRKAARVVSASSTQVQHMAVAINERRLR